MQQGMFYTFITCSTRTQWRFQFFVIFTLKRPYIYTLFGGFQLQIALNLLEYVLFYLFHLHALPFSNIPCVGT